MTRQNHQTTVGKRSLTPPPPTRRGLAPPLPLKLNHIANIFCKEITKDLNLDVIFFGSVENEECFLLICK
jgi:hypothetical protein